MARETLTDEQVEQEIERLRSSEAVKLVYKYEAYQYRRRSYMYRLRNQEKKGLKLMREGINMDNLDEFLQEGGDP